MKKPDKGFEGWYLKHQKNNNTIAFIPGRARDTAFVQVITNDKSCCVRYPLSDYYQGETVKIGSCVFSKRGIKVDIDADNLRVFGEISYSRLTPIKYDIMGPFKYFPMECRHGIISMSHNLNGWMNISGQLTDFTGGRGYIEKDGGISFPKTYLWVQCNDFKEECSVMLSIADIPFCGLNFKGCVCVVRYEGKEYRLATYLGVKIVCCSENRVVLKQGKYCLFVSVQKNSGNILYAPCQGAMDRSIHESVSCKTRFHFLVDGSVLFDLESDNAGFEYV